MLSRAKIFSELDHNQGYNQLKLAEESRYITTMQHTWYYTDTNTYSSVNRQQDFPWDSVLLADIKGAASVSDDILCFGVSQEDHDTELQAIFQHLREKALTLKTKKCEYNKTLLEFLGHVMPSTNKIKTILDLPTPKNASDVQEPAGNDQLLQSTLHSQLVNHNKWTLTINKINNTLGLNASS